MSYRPKYDKGIGEGPRCIMACKPQIKDPKEYIPGPGRYNVNQSKQKNAPASFQKEERSVS
jgi:hypothetical protein